MKIRRCTPDDTEALCRMASDFHAASCYAASIPLDLRTFVDVVAKLATSPEGVVFVAENDDGAVCGMAGAMANPSWFNASHISGQELFWWADPSVRGTGTGLRLIEAMEQWARDIGCHSFAMASTSNIKAGKLAKLYARRGYLPEDIYYRRSL